MHTRTVADQLIGVTYSFASGARRWFTLKPAIGAAAVDPAALHRVAKVVDGHPQVTRVQATSPLDGAYDGVEVYVAPGSDIVAIMATAKMVAASILGLDGHKPPYACAIDQFTDAEQATLRKQLVAELGDDVVVMTCTSIFNEPGGTDDQLCVPWTQIYVFGAEHDHTELGKLIRRHTTASANWQIIDA
ncbi:MAG TPA: hypothetical protein VLF91_05235 [Candidatus Saccharimonadales bacterium]|nr:hypothetical protein [Candidatus Saccharimonadales bacterium]